uniref:Pentatricopeptide repeat-containing protein n=1 Tax=Oryza nivara TaxID=4536 RepID=A0A0E0G2B6_ORYNI
MAPLLNRTAAPIFALPSLLCPLLQLKGYPSRYGLSDSKFSFSLNLSPQRFAFKLQNRVNALLLQPDLQIWLYIYTSGTSFIFTSTIKTSYVVSALPLFNRIERMAFVIGDDGWAAQPTRGLWRSDGSADGGGGRQEAAWGGNRAARRRAASCLPPPPSALPSLLHNPRVGCAAQPSSHITNAILSILLKSGSAETTYEVFMVLVNMKLVPDVYMYNQICKSGCSNKALTLFCNLKANL